MDEQTNPGGRLQTRHVASLTTGPGQDPSRFTVRATLASGETYRVAPDFPTRADAAAELDRLRRVEWLTVHTEPTPTR